MYPNILGAGCNYKSDAIYLKGKKCKLGLPNFMPSFFQKANFISTRLCFNDTAFFDITSLPQKADSVYWNFNDPKTGPENTSRNNTPYHRYSAAGTYKPRLIIYYSDGVIDTITQSIRITNGEKPALGADRQVCDSAFTNLSISARFFRYSMVNRLFRYTTCTYR